VFALGLLLDRPVDSHSAVHLETPDRNSCAEIDWSPDTGDRLAYGQNRRADRSRWVSGCRNEVFGRGWLLRIGAASCLRSRQNRPALLEPCSLHSSPSCKEAKVRGVNSTLLRSTPAGVVTWTVPVVTPSRHRRCDFGGRNDLKFSRGAVEADAGCADQIRAKDFDGRSYLPAGRDRFHERIEADGQAEHGPATSLAVGVSAISGCSIKVSVRALNKTPMDAGSVSTVEVVQCV
jgi:hypothetical protein